VGKIWESIRDFIVQYPLLTLFDHFLETKTGKMVCATVAVWLMSGARWIYKRSRGLSAPVALGVATISTVAITALLVLYFLAVSSEPSESSHVPASIQMHTNKGIVTEGQSGGSNIGTQINNYGNGPSPSVVPTPTVPLSLEDLFDTDFPYANIGRALTMSPAENQSALVTVKSRLFLDFDARSEILSLYMPFQIDDNLAFTIANGMAAHVAEIVDLNSDINKQVQLNSSVMHPGESAQTPLNELRFSGRVYIYLENDPTDAQKANIEAQYTCRNIAVQIRGMDWEALHMHDKRPFPLSPHLGTDFYHVTYTLPSSQIAANGDRLAIRVRILPTPSPIKTP
jgi:hypothetical protein